MILVFRELGGERVLRLNVLRPYLLNLKVNIVENKYTFPDQLMQLEKKANVFRYMVLSCCWETVKVIYSHLCDTFLLNAACARYYRQIWVFDNIVLFMQSLLHPNFKQIVQEIDF